MVEYVNNEEEKSILEHSEITNIGENPFEKANYWWYILGICFFGLIGSNTENLIIDMLKIPSALEYYKRDFFNIAIYFILPISSYIISKIMFLVFVYKKWKLVSQANAEVPYTSNVVLRKYIYPIIYIFFATILFAFIVTSSTNQGVLSLLLIIRGLILLIFSIYLIIWNYRLMVFFPQFFNPIQSFLKNYFFSLPKNIGYFIWGLPIISNACLYATFFIKNATLYEKSGNNTIFFLAQTLRILYHYGITIFYIILAVYIFIIIKSSKQLYKNEIE